jgi:TrmH family RNA methyltransferase
MAQVKAVTSRDNPLLVRLRKLLRDPAGYRKTGELWLEGDHLCSAFAQRGGRPSQAVVTEAGWQDDALRTMAMLAESVIVIPTALMASVSSLESPPSIGFVIEWNAAGELRPNEPTVVLDRLQDAGNAGTILRSAGAFGFTQVVAIKGTVALWSAKVLRAGMGAHFGLHLVEGMDVLALSNLTVPLLATSSHAAQAIHQVQLPWPCAWVLGHEGQGVSEALMQRCALSLRIPQPGGEESLNVGAATAICLYESARQRSGG